MNKVDVGAAAQQIARLLLSQQNMTGSAGSLSPGERVGVWVFAYEPNSWCNHPLPRPLPQGEGVKPADAGHIGLTY